MATPAARARNPDPIWRALAPEVVEEEEELEAAEELEVPVTELLDLAELWCRPVSSELNS